MEPKTNKSIIVILKFSHTQNAFTLKIKLDWTLSQFKKLLQTHFNKEIDQTKELKLIFLGAKNKIKDDEPLSRILAEDFASIIIGSESQEKKENIKYKYSKHIPDKLSKQEIMNRDEFFNFEEWTIENYKNTLKM